MRSIFLHLHPSKVSGPSLALHRTFGLGGMAALLIGSETSRVLTHSPLPVLVVK